MGVDAIRCAQCAALNPAEGTHCAECHQPLARSRLGRVVTVLLGAAVALVVAYMPTTKVAPPAPGSPFPPAATWTKRAKQPAAGAGVTDPGRTGGIKDALDRAAAAPPIQSAVAVLPLTDERGRLTPEGTVVALLAMYKATYIPRRTLDTAFPESLYTYRTACAFEAGKPLAGEVEKLARQAIHRPQVASGQLRKTGSGWEVQLRFEPAGSQPVVTVTAPDLTALPGLIAKQVHAYLNTALTDDEQRSLAQPELVHPESFAALARLHASRPGSPGYVNGLMLLREREPQSTLLTATWLDQLAVTRDSRLNSDLAGPAAAGEHDLLRYMRARFTPGTDADRAGRLLDVLGAEYVRTRYHDDLMTVLERLDRWADVDAVLQFWTTRQPDSGRAHHMYGSFLRDFAWRARGTGWASSVTEDGHRLFQERLKKAAAELEAAWKLMPDQAQIATTRIWVGIGSGAPREEIEEWFHRGLSADPDDVQLHLAKLEYLKPKWYGTRDEMLKFARETAKGANGGRRALVLWEAHDELSCRSLDGAKGPHDHAVYFRDPEVAREVLAMLEAVLAKTPKDYYALQCRLSLAWTAQDGATAAKVLEALGPETVTQPRGHGWPQMIQLAGWARRVTWKR